MLGLDFEWHVGYDYYCSIIISMKEVFMLFHSIEEESAAFCFEVGPSGSCILLGV